jgi:hypothetical protein
MTTLAETRTTIDSARVGEDSLEVSLGDGRVVSVPLAWYPRLVQARESDRNAFRLIGQGHGISWPEIDEDISLENILQGRPSSESGESFRRWLEAYRGKNG